MKRTRKDKTISTKNTEEVVERMVLRSRKKTGVTCTTPANLNSSVHDNGVSSDVSDCVIICEKLAKPKPHGNSLKKPYDSDNESVLITSTPIKNLRPKKPKFDDNCENVSESAKNISFSGDVIVLSDSSKSNLQVIEISDDCSPTKNDISEIKIQPNSGKIEENKLQNEVVQKNVQSINFYSTKPKFDYNCKKVLFESLFRKKKKKFYKNVKKNKKDKWILKTNVPKQKINPQISSTVGENIFLDKPIVLPKTGLRPIIIDGSNVAFHHSNNCYFSCKGLEICIKYFKQRGHEVTAFVPQFRMQNNKSDNPRLLDQLVKNGDVILTPSRTVNGCQIVSYDDRYIVQTAVLKGGIIVSRDNYRDLLEENPAWSETINYRLLQFTWVKDMLIFPKDPLGENGPILEEFLKFG